jgi:hypothetical protein
MIPEVDPLSALHGQGIPCTLGSPTGKGGGFIPFNDLSFIWAHVDISWIEPCIFWQ